MASQRNGRKPKALVKRVQHLKQHLVQHLKKCCARF